MNGRCSKAAGKERMVSRKKERRNGEPDSTRAPTSYYLHLLHVISVVIRPLTRGERSDKRSKDSYTKCTDGRAPHVLLLSGIQPCLVEAFIESSRVMVGRSFGGSDEFTSKLRVAELQMLYLKFEIVMRQVDKQKFRMTTDGKQRANRILRLQRF